jgi:hypothetical protein
MRRSLSVLSISVSALVLAMVNGCGSGGGGGDSGVAAPTRGGGDSTVRVEGVVDDGWVV